MAIADRINAATAQAMEDLKTDFRKGEIKEDFEERMAELFENKRAYVLCKTNLPYASWNNPKRKQLVTRRTSGFYWDL